MLLLNVFIYVYITLLVFVYISLSVYSFCFNVFLKRHQERVEKKLSRRVLISLGLFSFSLARTHHRVRVSLLIHQVDVCPSLVREEACSENHERGVYYVIHELTEILLTKTKLPSYNNIVL